MANRILFLKRFSFTPFGIFSVLEENNIPVILCGELPWKDNKPFVSCVPAGKHNLARFFSPRFKMWTYVLTDVVGRDKCMFHPANTFVDDPNTLKDEKQLDGCIATGLRFNWFENVLGLAESKIAHNIFMEHMAGVETAKLIIQEWKN